MYFERCCCENSTSTMIICQRSYLFCRKYFIPAFPVIGFRAVNELSSSSLAKYACSSPHFKGLRDYDLTVEVYERGEINSRGFY